MPRAKTLKDGRPNQANMAATCPVCQAVVSNRTDLPRHMRIHSSDKQKFMHRCPYPNCTFENLQKSNVETHIRTHTKSKTNNCPECDFTTADPGSLTRHRKRIHGYTPKERRSRQPLPHSADPVSQTVGLEGSRTMQMSRDPVSAVMDEPFQQSLPSLSIAIPEYYSTGPLSCNRALPSNHFVPPFESAPMPLRRVSEVRLERESQSHRPSEEEWAR